MDFGYQITDKKNYFLIKVTGNLMEKNQAAEMMEEINNIVARTTPFFVIDFSGFKYMNSTGLNVLLNVFSLARKSGGEAVVCCVSEKIRSLLVITKLVNVFTVLDNEEEAVKSLKIVN